MRLAGVGGSLAGDAADFFGFLHHLVHGEAFFRERAGGAGLHALAAGGAVVRVAPIVFEIADDARIDAARGDFPDVSALDFCANAHATRAENAAVVIEDEAGMGHVYGEAGVVVRVPYVRDAQRLRHGLQLAVTIRNTRRADVVALDQKQLDGHAPVESEARRLGFDRHAFLHGRGAGGQQAIRACQFDHAQAASAHGAETLEIAERGNVLSVGTRGFKNGVAFVRCDQFAVDANGDDFGFCLGFHVYRLSLGG